MPCGPCGPGVEWIASTRAESALSALTMAEICAGNPFTCEMSSSCAFAVDHANPMKSASPMSMMPTSFATLSQENVCMSVRASLSVIDECLVHATAELGLLAADDVPGS